MDQENLKSCLPAKAKMPAKPAIRNPLGDISENIPQNKAVKSRKIVTSKVVRKSKSVSSKNPDSGAVETQLEYYKKTENVTEHKNKSEKVTTVDEVFVSGVDHYLNYMPVIKNIDLVGNLKCKSEGSTSASSESTKNKKPVQKVNLIKKLSNRSSRLNEEELYENYFYDDYLEDNYQYMIDMEDNFVYDKGILVKRIDNNYRMIVVNWLVYVNEKLRLTEKTFFMAIRMFDYIIASRKLLSDKYTLTAVTCLWIVNKYSDIRYITVSKLAFIFNNKFPCNDILAAERDILRALKFEICVPEPMTFLAYYLKKQSLENNSKIRCSAIFLLEVLSLTLEFSSLPPSVLASIALYQVLIKYNLENVTFLEYIYNNLCSQEKFLDKSRHFEKIINYVLNAEKVCSEIITKYSTEERCNVANIFLPK